MPGPERLGKLKVGALSTSPQAGRFKRSHSLWTLWATRRRHPPIQLLTRRADARRFLSPRGAEAI